MKLKIYALTAALLFSPKLSAALDCSVPQEKQLLHLTYPAKAQLQNPVDVEFSLYNDILKVNFRVRTPTINAKEHLGANEYPYQQDVVEVFLSVSGDKSGLPYYEFELSPYNNTFEVRVDDLKKPFTNHLKMGVEYQAVFTKTGWQGSMEIPLRNLGWNGDPALLVGNAFSILGKSPHRSFWSLYLPPQKKPSFHQPQYFRPLLKCSAEDN